ncbi:hypothetical protein CLU79DRAFT_746595 [Phycomyces nitens]|nr:hypothetical protein CLU79DRAFT_746595 [Phycomyces nitens]
MFLLKQAVWVLSLSSLLILILTSWLETLSTQNCSFRSTMSIKRLHLARSTPDTPHTVSFGLWRQCWFHDSGCICTPTSLSYTPDSQLVASSGSVAKAVLFILSNISLLFAVILHHFSYPFCLFFTLLGLVWTASGFGITYHRYHQHISAYQSQYQSHTQSQSTFVQSNGLETVLYGLAIGFIVVLAILLLVLICTRQPDKTDHQSLQSIPSLPIALPTRPFEALVRDPSLLKPIALHPPPNHCNLFRLNKANNSTGTLSTIAQTPPLRLVPASATRSRWSRPLAKRESQCSHHTFGSDSAWTYVPRQSAETVTTTRSPYPQLSSQFCMTPGCGQLDPDYFGSTNTNSTLFSSSIVWL